MKTIKKISIISVLIVVSFCIFTPLLSAETIKTPEGVIITHYPDKFDGMGIINSIEMGGVVIDDLFMPFSPHVKYMTPRNRYASLRHFKPGEKVGYVLNDKNQITTLCLILNMVKR